MAHPHAPSLASLVCTAVLTLAGTAHATETGGTMYPNGVENFMVGAMPPPGLYGMVYGESYSAHRLNDGGGNNLNLPVFSLKANVVAPRLIYVSGTKVLDGALAFHVIAPIVDLKVSVPGASQHKTGLGDLIVGSALGFHHSQKVHSIVAMDVCVPTGAYTATEVANIGRNYWAFEPNYMLSRVDPSGLNADVKAGYIFNGRNDDTGYRSGQEFHFDYSVGWGFASQWVAGLGGYYYEQTSADKQAGTSVAGGNKGKAFAIGPSVKFDSGKHWFVTFKWQKETLAENRPEGQAVWLKAVFPL